MMNRLVIVLSALGLGWGGELHGAEAGGATASGTIYRHHFVGAGQLARDTNAGLFHLFGTLPSAGLVGDQILDKLARAPGRLWKGQLPAGVPDQADLLRALLDQAVTGESLLEVGGAGESIELALAVRLRKKQVQLWEDNLRQLLTNWQIGKPTDGSWGSFSGWEMRRSEKPQRVRFVRAGEWVLVGLGPEPLPLLSAWVEQAGRNGRPGAASTNLLEVSADWPRLSRLLPALARWPLPSVDMTVSARDGNLRTEARLRSATPFAWKPELWSIPTNTIRDPLISFTVARGAGPVLKQWPLLRDLGVQDQVNQFCAWGQSHPLALLYLSVPVADATNVINRLAVRLPQTATNYLPQHLGEFLWVSNRAEVFWQGLPFIMPRLQPISDGGRSYLLGGIFPLLGETNPPPAELYAQILNRPNLIYYDWELSGERLPHAQQFHQLYDIVSDRQLPSENAPAEKWLSELAPHLGNTITELTLASPKELWLVRKSQVGLTGFELATLARWVESPGFPLSLDRPPLLQGGKGRPTPQDSPR